MKITPEISAPVEKIDIFGSLKHVLNFWIYSVDKVSVVGTRRSARKSLFFQHFHMCFCILSPFHDIFLGWTNKNLSFKLK